MIFPVENAEDNNGAVIVADAFAAEQIDYNRDDRDGIEMRNHVVNVIHHR